MVQTFLIDRSKAKVCKVRNTMNQVYVLNNKSVEDMSPFELGQAMAHVTKHYLDFVRHFCDEMLPCLILQRKVLDRVETFSQSEKKAYYDGAGDSTADIQGFIEFLEPVCEFLGDAHDWASHANPDVVVALQVVISRLHEVVEEYSANQEMNMDALRLFQAVEAENATNQEPAKKSGGTHDVP